MASSPVFSVIIPAHNAAAWIAGAIASVRRQDVVDGGSSVEIVVVDDRSTDATSAELERVAGPDLVVVRTDVGSPGGARNVGMGVASGQLIAFLDSDDELLPDALRLLRAALDAGIGFAYGDATIVDSDGTITPRRACPGDGTLAERLLWGNCLTMGAVLFERTALDEVGPFDEELRTGEDWDLWLRSAARFSGAHVPLSLARIRRSAFDDKYSLADLELATERVLGRYFDDRPDRELRSVRRRVYAWNTVVLAKSHLRRGALLRGAAHAIRAVAWSPRAMVYLRPAARPNGRISDLSQ